MRFWPGNKRETRADSLTATLIALIQERSSGGTTATSQATGALEACAGLVQRAFLVADVDAPPALIVGAHFGIARHGWTFANQVR